uniref:Uncharacterized protein n=1 Tax=Anguilla anguilla TaxID=7936 RepID=A0A0E9TZ78_ANGAN
MGIITFPPSGAKSRHSLVFGLHRPLDVRCGRIKSHSFAFCNINFSV